MAKPIYELRLKFFEEDKEIVDFLKGSEIITPQKYLDLLIKREYIRSNGDIDITLSDILATIKGQEPKKIENVEKEIVIETKEVEEDMELDDDDFGGLSPQ